VRRLAPASRLLAEGDGPALAWEEVLPAIADQRFYWLATVTTGGAPHVRPVLAVWADGSLCSTSSPAARKARNLAADPRCSFTIRTEQLDVVLEGEAGPLRDPSELQRVADVYLEKYGWPVTVEDGAFVAPYGAPTAGPPPYEVFRVVPTTVLAFGTDDETGPRSTRFRF
jgi:nitroimidazol reductase NimA-like FMN-containing flavoprotein (pyridoxamine 5'-phosphate oxidase superfamily)